MAIIWTVINALIVQLLFRLVILVLIVVNALPAWVGSSKTLLQMDAHSARIKLQIVFIVLQKLFVWCAIKIIWSLVEYVNMILQKHPSKSIASAKNHFVSLAMKIPSLTPIIVLNVCLNIILMVIQIVKSAQHLWVGVSSVHLLPVLSARADTIWEYLLASYAHHHWQGVSNVVLPQFAYSVKHHTILILMFVWIVQRWLDAKNALMVHHA